MKDGIDIWYSLGSSMKFGCLNLSYVEGCQVRVLLHARN